MWRQYLSAVNDSHLDSNERLLEMLHAARIGDVQAKVIVDSAGVLDEC
jgi:hypothetical protein